MFNLNDKNFGGGATVFNNGVAGKIENVTLDVNKREMSDPDNSPDYKVVFTDVAGGQINTGFYYHKDNALYDEKRNRDLEGWTVGRVLSIANAVVEENFLYEEFSEETPSKKIIDYLFKVIKDNCGGKTVNLYTNYGTKAKPSQYLSTRYFNFIEKTGTPENASKLKFSPNDNLDKLTPDAPASTGGTTATAKAAW